MSLPDWVLPALVCSAIFYVIPAAICYWAYKIDTDKSQKAHDICFIPAFNVFLALPSIGIIIENYWPTPQDPDDPYFKATNALRQELENIQNGSAARNERRQKYATEFIKDQQLQRNFDEYCDSRELMRTMQRQGAK